MTTHNPQASRHVLNAAKPCGKLPAYLHRRGSTYYFKRKVPADAAGAFPTYGKQVWKALGTPLFEKAKVMLAVEVSEFDFILARHRRERAAKPAGVADEFVPAPSALSAAKASSPFPDAQDLERHELLRTLEQGLERLRTMTQGSVSTPQIASVAQNAPVTTPGASARKKKVPAQSPTVRGKIPLTMMHVLGLWWAHWAYQRYTVGTGAKRLVSTLSGRYDEDTLSGIPFVTTATHSKSERIDVRASAPVKQLLQEAARVSHKNVSEFLLDAGIVAANQTLADRTRFELTPEKWREFHAALDRPVSGKPKLLDLVSKPGLLG